MKILDIALKDIWHSFRNAMFIVFGLVLPLATGALFYLAFGGLASDDGGLDLEPTQVRVVNLDRGQMGFSAGELLATAVQDAIPEMVYGQWKTTQLMGGTAPDMIECGLGIPYHLLVQYYNRQLIESLKE